MTLPLSETITRNIFSCTFPRTMIEAPHVFHLSKTIGICNFFLFLLLLLLVFWMK